MKKIITIIIGLVLAFTFVSSVSAATPDELVGWWKMDDASDSSAYTNDGAETNVTFSSGSALFNGSTSKIVVPDSSSLDITDEITIEAWVKTDNVTKNQQIVDKGEHTSSTGYMLMIYGGNLYGRVNKDNDTACVQPYPADDNWHHVAYTFKSDEQKMYIDGDIVCSKSKTTTITPNDHEVLIGNGVNRETVYQWDGEIDDVKIWNKAISEFPYGVIFEPEEDEIVYGETDLVALYVDGDDVNDNAMRWAVRYDTCKAATSTVFGNVDGFHDPFDWDGMNFSAVIDTSTVDAGHYCFVLNPLDDNEGEVDVRETRWFYVAEGRVSGGGQIIEEDGSKKKDWNKISFGGNVWDLGDTYVGEWEVNFHNVGDDDFDKSKFHSDDIRVLNFYDGNSETCHEAMNMTMYGKWNGIDDYKVIVRAGDIGSPGHFTEEAYDTVRIELFAPNGTRVYDTHKKGEFKDESTCVGTARTGLDNGNITIVH